MGTIPNRFVRSGVGTRPCFVFLPPGYTPAARYPTVYILHGLPGSPFSIVHGLRLAGIADRLIVRRLVRPFIAVMPTAGPRHYDGEWAGVWEAYVVHSVLPWVDAHLSTVPGARGRAIAGLSAGGFGAVDIALRHPMLFGTVESWSGYFEPPRDGPLAHASRGELDRHDPVLLVRAEASFLRRAGTRFFLSSGTTNDRWTAARTREFARELAAVGIRHRLWLAPGGHNGRLWRAQLPAALRFAAPSSGSQS